MYDAMYVSPLTLHCCVAPYNATVVDVTGDSIKVRYDGYKKEFWLRRDSPRVAPRFRNQRSTGKSSGRQRGEKAPPDLLALIASGTGQALPTTTSGRGRILSAPSGSAEVKHGLMKTSVTVPLAPLPNVTLNGVAIFSPSSE